MKKICFTLLASALLQSPAWAQGAAATDPKIATVLAALPAKNATVLTSSMAAVASLGEDAYVSLISGLAAPGKGNNSSIEYTVGGFSAYVTQPGNEAQRKMAVSAYCKALQKLTDKQSKQFIISQFDIVGTDDAVATLQPYLTDNDLGDAAARALAKINTLASKTALLSALPQANGAAKLFIIEALGDSRYKSAAATINKIAAGDDTAATKPALYALAYIADPSSATVLASAAAKAGYKYEKTNATQAYLVYAEQLLKNSNRELATKIAIDLSAKAKDLVNVRAGALKILIEATKGNQQFLLTAAGDSNAQYRAAALRYALPYVNATNINLWMKKLTVVSNEAKVDILFMLGQTNVKTALPAILALAKDKDAAVKQAAINAALAIGQDQVLGSFFKLMSVGTSDDIDMLADAIGHMKGTGINEKIGAAIQTAPEKMQVALIDILDTRADNSQWSVIWAQLKSPHAATKNKAFAALGHTATKDNAPQLFTLLNESTGPDEVAVQDALTFLYNGAADAQVDLALQQLNTASAQKKLLYYKILAAAGSKKALKVVADAYAGGNAETQSAALSALSTWNGGDAASELLKIARTSKDANVTASALGAYLASVKQATDTPEEKLLKLREAFSITQSAGQKQQIMKEIAQAPCFNTLIFAGKYLDDADLNKDAANAVVASALAGTYNGGLIKGLLNKAIPLASAKQKAAATKYLAGMKDSDGFTSMYNGADLTGWKGLVADPIKRAAMDAKTLAAAQEKADVEAKDSWKPINGELQFVGKGNNLATVKKYRDVEMYVDWKIIDDKKGEGDAGIYLRGSPQVQIWDLARTNVGAQVGSGGLYNNQVHPAKPLKVADNKLDEWNTFHIIMIGDRVTVYLNGELVTDNTILENYWNRKIPIFAEEQIELQAHGSPVAYRDLYIREIPSEKPFELSKEEQKDGYKILFDGTNMFSWTGNTIDYALDSGTLAIHPRPGKGSGGNLYTKDEYGDFIFRFEFQLTPGANNGLGIRTPMEGDAAYVGMELQILDNEDPMYKDLHVYQYHGSIYGTIPAKRGFLKPVGQWNYEEVVVKGPKIKITLNGTVIIEADITEARKNGAADGKPHPGLQNETGHIGFLGHGSVVKFKNIRIKDLAEKK